MKKVLIPLAMCILSGTVSAADECGYWETYYVKNCSVEQTSPVTICHFYTDYPNQGAPNSVTTSYDGHVACPTSYLWWDLDRTEHTTKTRVVQDPNHCVWEAKRRWVFHDNAPGYCRF
ncbi:hypothetical protein [Pseudoalteromonas rubra]|uniref:hypothetical protein n=1 Tax=Pseudoalteromonas rubra TaxID=43658 RepID=UPI0012DD48F3|nr:hypothetical protein [Pseudoalteromonas rubra]